MLEVSSEAKIKLEEFFAAEGGEKSAIRIAVMGGGNQGPSLGLIIDEPSDSDFVDETQGIPLIVEGGLMHYCQSISIDFTIGTQGTCGGASGSGFLIKTKVPLNF